MSGEVLAVESSDNVDRFGYPRMSIIDVDKARTVIVIKRSLSPGFAGIPNPLFAMDNTMMFFSDGKVAIQDLINAIKENQ